MYARGMGALRRHKTTKSKGIGMSTRTAIATRFLYVLIFFFWGGGGESLNMILLFGIDLNPLFQ